MKKKKEEMTPEEQSEIRRRKESRRRYAALQMQWLTLRLTGKERTKALKKVNEKFTQGAVLTRKRLAKPPGKRKTVQATAEGQGQPAGSNTEAA